MRHHLGDIAAVCVEVVDRDPGALLGNDDLAARFLEAGALIELIGSQLHDGTERGTACPARLRDTVRTCNEA